MHTPSPDTPATEPPTAGAAPTPPEGFAPIERLAGGYFGQLGTVYRRRVEGGGVVIGVFIEERHLNQSGVAHGGMLTTLADSALGINFALARKRHGQVTVSLSCDFLSPARPGDWLEAQVDVRRVGRRLGFADCVLRVGERRVLRASGVFAFSEPAEAEQGAKTGPG